MVYTRFANFSKSIAHTLVDYTFPSTPTIATISGGLGWYAYQYSMTYSQGFLANAINAEFKKSYGPIGHTIGHFGAPLIVPWLAPYISAQISVGATLTSSLVLNLIAQTFFGVVIEKRPTVIIAAAPAEKSAEAPPQILAPAPMPEPVKPKPAVIEKPKVVLEKPVVIPIIPIPVPADKNLKPLTKIAAVESKKDTKSKTTVVTLNPKDVEHIRKHRFRCC